MKYGWQLNSESWFTLSTDVIPLPWACVPFRQSFANQVIDVPGVYLICGHTPIHNDARPFRHLFNVIYAGLSTTSVRTRFRAHLTNPKPRLRDAVNAYGAMRDQLKFYFAQAPAVIVPHLESLLIDCFGPTGNSQAGTTVTATVNYNAAVPAG